MAATRMNDKQNEYNQHTPVMLLEAVSHLIHAPDGVYIDATFGRGSHSQAILNKLSLQGRLIAFDKDPDSIAYAKRHIHDQRFSIMHRSFATLEATVNELQLVGKISGILFDLGVSSPQLDNPERGFSFMRDGKLDMRMDTTQGIDAATWLAKVDEKELADSLFLYGDEKFSRRIAKAIVEARALTPITTTLQLGNIITQAVPKTKSWADKHPATRSFQAIRIVVNQELAELEQALAQAYQVLAPHGRLAVISFHSLEDRIVKQFIRTHEKGTNDIPRGLPIKDVSFQSTLISVGKPLKPSDEEMDANVRARSAILRIAEKIS